LRVVCREKLSRYSSSSRERSRENASTGNQKRSSRRKKRKKKQFISCAFSAFLSLFFVTCQLCSFFPSLFHNHKECPSRSRIKCNPSNPPTRALPSSRYTFSLSLFLSPLSTRVLFCPSLPFSLFSSFFFFLWVALDDDF